MIKSRHIRWRDMVHPTELLRSDTLHGQQFAAPANILSENPIDCGIEALPCIKRFINLEKYAKPGYFVGVLALVGFLQAVLLTYFRQTAQLWGEQYNIPSNAVDWLIYTNEFFVGVFALAVAYWGNRIHRASWTGGLTILLAIASLTWTVPEAYLPRSPSSPAAFEPNLCKVNKTLPILIEKKLNHVALLVLLIFQILLAMASVSFTTHGITYLDDNISPKRSPIYISLALAGKEMGKQCGLYVSWLPFFARNNTVFISPIWISAASLTFLAGIAVAMFPKYLPSLLMKRAAASILDLAAGRAAPRPPASAVSFLVTIRRLLINRILTVNIGSILLVQTALINFGIFEKYFYQSRYHIPALVGVAPTYFDPPLAQFTSNLLKHPLVTVSLIATGVIIVKARPRAMVMVKWNVGVYATVALLFGVGLFLKCDNSLEIEYKNILTVPYCSAHCTCDLRFQPICLQKKTYFSPCFAGCTAMNEISPNNRIYQNCTCGNEWYQLNNHEAIEGSCSAKKCNLVWAFVEVNNVIATALLATTWVTNLVINMRCICPKDKAVALGVEAMLIGIVPYWPVKGLYGVAADKFCKFRNRDGCQLFSDSFAVFLSVNTVLLIAMAAGLAAWLLLLIGKLNVYKMANNDADRDAVGIDENLEERHSLVEVAYRRRRRSEEVLDLELQEGATGRRRASSGVSSAGASSLLNADIESLDSLVAVAQDASRKRRSSLRHNRQYETAF